MSGPFDPYVPSVFIVCSPFQALCAVACIRNLQIEDYIFIAVVSGKRRDTQLINFLNGKNIHFLIFKLTKLNLLIKLLSNIIGIKGKYERMFIGDFSQSYMLSVGMPFAKKNANVVYLDDGSSVISMLQDSFMSWDSMKSRKIYGAIAKMRGMNILTNFYTIYSDIQSLHYNLRTNELSSFLNQDIKNVKFKNVIFIGTNIDSYCSQLEIDRLYYVEQLDKAFQLMISQNPNEKIIYIPHGNDCSEYAKELCRRYDAIFEPLDVMIEYYIANNTWVPVVIYGFCSTALLNIKRMVPNIRAVSILAYGSDSCIFLGKYKSIMDYYKRNNIECIEWQQTSSLNEKGTN